MKPVADLAEMARVFAAEHYIGQFDGYSYGSTQAQPNNYYLHSDDAGRFSMIVTGTDQTWVDGPNFGLTGNGVLFRECLADAGCQPLYIAALRQIAANKQVADLAATARAIDERDRPLARSATPGASSRSPTARRRRTPRSPSWRPARRSSPPGSGCLLHRPGSTAPASSVQAAARKAGRRARDTGRRRSSSPSRCP